MMISANELSEIWQTKSASLALLARSLGDDGEDSVQEAFLKLAIEQPKPNDAVAWLFRVVRNQALTHRRSRKRRMERETKVVLAREIELGNSWFIRSPEIDTQLDSQVATLALSELSEQEREIVILHLWGDLAFRQIAEVLQMPAATVHRRYQEALEALRVRLRLEAR